MDSIKDAGKPDYLVLVLRIRRNSPYHSKNGTASLQELMETEGIKIRTLHTATKDEIKEEFSSLMW